MKHINLSSENAREKVETELEKLQKRCTARTIDFSDIVKCLERIEGLLDISKKNMQGIIATVDLNGQQFPNSYKYIPYSTWFCAQYRSGHWTLTSLYRDITSCPSKRIRLKLPEIAKEAIVHSFEAFW